MEKYSIGAGLCGSPRTEPLPRRPHGSTERPGQKALAPNGNLAIASQRYQLTQEEKALIKPPEYKMRGLRVKRVPVTAEALGAMWKEAVSDLYLVQAGTERGQSLAQPAGGAYPRNGLVAR